MRSVLTAHSPEFVKMLIYGKCGKNLVICVVCNCNLCLLSLCQWRLTREEGEREKARKRGREMRKVDPAQLRLTPTPSEMK